MRREVRDTVTRKTNEGTAEALGSDAGVRDGSESAYDACQRQLRTPMGRRLLRMLKWRVQIGGRR